MGRITLQQAADWCGGRIDPKYADVTFLGAANDSRSIVPGQLFLALEGVRDGHAYIPMALEKGAAAVLCRHCDGDYPAIVVEDVRLALGRIAQQERKRLGIQVVGVTGSVGKSTTKEMIACVLESTYRVAKTPANHNNDIGMPMAILSIPEDAQIAVLEMGMNHFGEIAYLSQIAQPDVGVIINIGTMHIENLGSREGILQAKMEIISGMQKNGQLILNGDDALLQTVSQKAAFPITYFGVHNTACQVCGYDVQSENNRINFGVRKDGKICRIQLVLDGEHYVPDALAAVSVGMHFGISEREIEQSLASFRNMEGRQEILQVKGCTIIKDYYNAGPESMAAALKVLGNKPGRRIAVLGDMLELGVCAEAEHYRIGRIAVEHADIILAYGPNGSRVVTGAITGGKSPERARFFEDKQALVRTLCRMAQPGDVILIKGSHGMHMEEVLDGFLSDGAHTAEDTL